MERGALIGGIVAVGLFGVIAAAFVMVGAGSGTGDPVPETTRVVVDPVPVASSDWEPKPTTPGNPRKVGDLPESPPVVTDDGVMRRPNPEGLGAEKWDEIRAAETAARRTRVAGIVDGFAANMSESDAERFRNIFDHVFDESAAIREATKNKEHTIKEQRQKLDDLRAETIEDLTMMMTGEEFSRLRTELRRADAALF
jgi:hypothetical protein